MRVEVDPAMVKTLGMLRLAEDTAIRAAMGEIGGEEAEDDG